MRLLRYMFIISLVIIFTGSIINIRKFHFLSQEQQILNENNENNENKSINKKYNIMRFILPTISIVSFFIGCYIVSLLIKDGESIGRDKYSGIIYMFVIGILLLIMNSSILSQDSITQYIKGKKFSILGMFMALGVGSVIFGFLDNFGMKLGTDALDDTFLHAFLGPFSKDERFKQYRNNIKKNLKIMNVWVNGDWRKVINHVLRFEKEISKNPVLKDLSNAIKGFDGVRLNIPPLILKDTALTNDYVDNLRSQYDTIDGSKAMLGNTFSDFIGALLGAGIINLFIYMTGYDGSFTGDENIDSSKFIKYLSVYAPVMEGVFIAIGCLVPVFLNIAMSRSGVNKNVRKAWTVVFIILILVILMMYLSVNGLKSMSTKDKKNSIKKTLKSTLERIDLKQNNNEEKKTFDKVNTLINNL